MEYIVTEFYSFYQLNKYGKVGKYAYVGTEKTKVQNGMLGDTIGNRKHFETEEQALQYYNSIELKEPKLNMNKEMELMVYSKEIILNDKTIKIDNNFGIYKD